MVGVSTIALVVATAAVAGEAWSPTIAAAFVALFAMPAGITTFALTLDAMGSSDVGDDPDGTGPGAVVAATIVVSSLVGLVTLAPTIAAVRALLEAVG
jgi:hypothetical protein